MLTLSSTVRLSAILLCLLLPLNSQAQETGYAAILRIIHADVEIQRANTTEWLPLSSNSEAPLGAGDKLRTNTAGRALLTFLEDVTILILPDTTLEILAFDQMADGSLKLSMHIQGQVIQQTTINTEFELFQLEANQITVTSPAELFAVWTQDEQMSVLTVAQGEAAVQIGESPFLVTQGQGIRATASNDADIASLDPPLNAARLIGLLDGCPGRTQTTGDLNINVRVGPGFDSTVIGSIPDEQVVQVMGVNRFGTWYRIQAFSGFGWIQMPLVLNSCVDLPAILSNTVEHNIGVWGVIPLELTLLEPFYGLPESDLWFYRSVESQP